MEKAEYIRSEAHRRFIASLCCIKCGQHHDLQCAHLRHGNNAGTAQKPCDKHSLPLCVSCHAKQHSMNEEMFWNNKMDIATDMAEDLFEHTGHKMKAYAIIQRGRKLLWTTS